MRALKLVNHSWVCKEIDDLGNPPKDWITVKVTSTGVCGSDMQKFMDNKFHTDITLGHEIVGVVYDPEGKSGMGGSRVVVDPIIPCNVCQFCREGSYQLCSGIQAIGRNINGGFASYVHIPKKNLLILPENVETDLGTLIDPLAVCFHAYNLLKQRNIERLDKILVIGDGTIGNIFSLLLSKLHPKSNISVLGKHVSKTSTLNAFGVLEIKGKVDNSDTDQYDLVIETVGRCQENTMRDAISCVRGRGCILVLGVFPENYYARVYLRELFYKEATLLGSNSYSSSKSKNEFLKSLEFMKDNSSMFKHLITKHLKLEDLPYYIAQLRSKDMVNKSIKTVVHP